MNGNSPRTLESIRHTLKYADTRPVVIIMIISGLLWSSFLMIPGEILSRSSVYGMMAQIMSQAAWAFWFLLISILQIIRLLWLNGESKLLQTCTIGIKSLSAATWLYISLTCLLAKWPPVVIAVDSVVIALAAMWDLLRFNEKGYRRTA